MSIAAIRGHWTPSANSALTSPASAPQGPTSSPIAARRCLLDLRQSISFLQPPDDAPLSVGLGGVATLDAHADSAPPHSHPILAFAPACLPSQLGDPAFLRDHRIRFAYVTGSMANGIASADIVEAIGHAGMLGFFGAAGLSPRRVEAAIDRIQQNLGPPGRDLPYGFNLIHTPNEPTIEAAIVDLYIRRGVHVVEASAYLDLTPHVLRYRLHGIHADARGNIVTPNRLIAKVSRTEVAAKFFAPPPAKMLADLVAAGHLTAKQAELAAKVPVAQDLTAEADSGGHTDNRPAICLLPTMIALRDRMQAQYRFTQRLRVGAAGGIATPAAAAAAFAMGASYIVTGSINQACIESGTSDLVRGMLAQAGQADVAMAPAADMFEMGVKLQVLKRGTMFAMRAGKLWETYRAYTSIEAIPEAERLNLEKTLFRAPLSEIWTQTAAFFKERDPSQLEKAARDPRHKMALVFRWYLGLSSHWANAGDASRTLDFQIWAGPAIGAFNEWAKGSFLETPANRTVVTLAHNLLYWAAVSQRVAMLRTQGVDLPDELIQTTPMESSQLEDFLR